MHGTFSLSINMHAQIIGTQKCLRTKSLESFDIAVVKKHTVEGNYLMGQCSAMETAHGGYSYFLG